MAFESSEMKGLEIESETISQVVSTGISSSHPTEVITSQFSMRKVLEMELQTTLSHNQGPSMQPIIRKCDGKEDSKSITVPTLPISHDAGFTSRKCFTGDEGETAIRFAQHIGKAPNRTVDLIEASETLGVQKEDLYKIIDIFKTRGAVVEEQQNKIRWVFDNSLAMKAVRVRRIRELKRKPFEEVPRSLSNENNGMKREGSWIFLTEADISDYVSFQSDVVMHVRCPSYINLEIPCPAQDGDVKQRRYRILRKRAGLKGNIIYYVSKLESHDVVVNLGETLAVHDKSLKDLAASCSMENMK